MATTTFSRINVKPAKPIDASGCAAAGSFAIGLITMVSALALSLVCSFEGLDLDRLETILLGVAFGFLGLGAHSMDQADEKRRAEW